MAGSRDCGSEGSGNKGNGSGQQSLGLREGGISDVVMLSQNLKDNRVKGGKESKPVRPW